MRVLITGAGGFVGKNLRLALAERKDVQVVSFTRQDGIADLPHKLDGVDFVIHLAGVNRPKDPAEFNTGNTELTSALAAGLRSLAAESARVIPVIYTSSTQAALDNPYGASKRAAENALQEAAAAAGFPVYLFRLPNVFGKWSRPNYNSAVATFCHNVARGIPIRIDNPDAALNLVYVDDVVQTFVRLLDGHAPGCGADGFPVVAPQYATTVGEIARLIHSFKESRTNLVTERVGIGFLRALYSTYVSYLPTEAFAYEVPKYGDPRGVFVEMLKTPDAGQFSYFTAHPGITRGGHYHHTKTEKFLVIKGRARFGFRHMDTGERFELITTGEKPEIVETVPGWTHDITNIGDDEMVVMLWANEIFDRTKPDTYACPV